MKYGIKLKGLNSPFWLMFMNEVKGYPTGPVVFDEYGDAEVWAQDHELKNYTIEVMNDFEFSGKRPPTTTD